MLKAQDLLRVLHCCGAGKKKGGRPSYFSLYRALDSVDIRGAGSSIP
jgi:hypothetical protein